MTKSQQRSKKSGKIPLATPAVLGCIIVAALLVFLLIPKAPKSSTPNAKGTTLPTAPVATTQSSNIKSMTVEMLAAEAMNACRDALKNFPQSSAPYLLMGDMHHKLGDSTEAVKWLNEAMKRDPKNMAIYLQLAGIAEERGDYEKAISHCKDAMRLGPVPEGLHHGLGSCLQQLGKTQEAVEALQQEIRLFPKTAASYRLLGQAYLQLKQYDKAVANYEKMLAIFPKDQAACYGLMNAYARLGQNDKSQEYREKFLALREQTSKAVRGRRDAFDDTERMRRLAAYAHTMSGEIFYTHQRAAEAEQHLKRAYDLDPGDTLCRGKLVSLCMAQKRHEDALAICQQLIQIEPGNPLHRQNSGVLLSTLKRFPESVDTLRKAVAADPNNPLGYRYLIKVLMQGTRDFPEARTVAEQLVRLDPTGSNYYVLSQTRQADNDLTGALDAIERACRLAPANKRIQQARLRLKEQIKQSPSRENK